MSKSGVSTSEFHFRGIGMPAAALGLMGVLFLAVSGVAIAREDSGKTAIGSNDNAAGSMIRFDAAPERLGVFYYAHERETDNTGFSAGLVMAIIDYAIHSTPELKRLSQSERDRLASLVDIADIHAQLLQQVQSGAGSSTPGTSVDLKYGMLQDMSTVVIKAEVRLPRAGAKLPPLQLVYQSNVHEVQAKTPAQVAGLLADVEQRRSSMSKRDYRKAVAEATSPQWTWPQIYSQHADYWAADNGEPLRAALREGSAEIAVMLIESVDMANSQAAVGDIVSESGQRRIRKERNDLVVSKNRNDPDYFWQANSYLK